MEAFLEGGTRHGRNLPGDPEMAEGVGPVGIGLDVEDRVPVRRFRPFLADEADHRQPVEKLAPRHLDVDVFLKPAQTDFHLS
jgi:hypothetical protein